MTRSEAQAIALLARIVNGAGRKQETSAGACPVASVPIGLLAQAREYLEGNRDRFLTGAPADVYGLERDAVVQAVQRIFE
jgi:hypothetical protein